MNTKPAIDEDNFCEVFCAAAMDLPQDIYGDSLTRALVDSENWQSYMALDHEEEYEWFDSTDIPINYMDWTEEHRMLFKLRYSI